MPAQSFQDLVAQWGGGNAWPDPAGTHRDVDLTIGIATYEDFHGAYFTVHSLLLHHPEVMDRTEIVVLDNNPSGPSAESLASMAGEFVRYVPYADVQSTAVRDVLFREARGDVVLVLDSHVLLAAGGVAALLRYYEDPAHALDMVQGPLTYGLPHAVAATQMNPVFEKGMYGVWGLDDRGLDPDADAFEIELHGLGLFAMRKDAWPGLNPRFRGFGGEEGYIQEKVRLAGGTVVCLPALRWQHRFLRPGGTPYRNAWGDRIHNYLVGWQEIGYDTGLVMEHFSELLGPASGRLLADAQREVAHPLRCVDGVIVLSDDGRVRPWDEARQQASEAGIDCIRHPVGVGEGRDSAVARAMDEALDRMRYRGWKTALFLDESWSLDLGLAHAVEAGVRQMAGGTTALFEGGVSAGDVGQAFLPGPVVTTTEPRPATRSIDEWLDARSGRRIHCLLPLAQPRGERVPLSDLVDQIVVWGPTEDKDLWLRHYHRFARFGFGRRAHRLALLERPALTLQAAARLDIAQRLEAIADDADPTLPVVMMRDSAYVLDGATHVLAGALREAAEHDWDVLSLSGVAGTTRAEPLEATSFLGTRARGHSGDAFVVAPAALRGVAQVLRGAADDTADEIGARFDRASAAGELRVLAVEPGVFATPDAIRNPSAQSVRRHRYSRP